MSRMLPQFARPLYPVLRRRLGQEPRFLQVILGPRQVGKTTLAQQLLAPFEDRAIYASADAGHIDPSGWLETQWVRARNLETDTWPILALDEVQKVPHWSEQVKRLWDEDLRGGRPMHVLLLGSSSLLLRTGMEESLAGRFERSWLGHWSLSEMSEAFGWDLPTWLRFGGYPGAVPLIEDPQRWAAYIRDSIIETAIAKDVLQLTRVHKPALLRQAFELACAYSAQELSYTKMLGQLHDAGNTTTLAHYLELLHGAGLVRTVPKYAGAVVRRRASSPKLLALNTALISASLPDAGATFSTDGARFGRLVESAVGAHLSDAEQRGQLRLHYWRLKNDEVDFVVERGSELWAIEVKSSSGHSRKSGIEAFRMAFPKARTLWVGPGGIPLEEFFSQDPVRWL